MNEKAANKHKRLVGNAAENTKKTPLFREFSLNYINNPRRNLPRNLMVAMAYNFHRRFASSG